MKKQIIFLLTFLFSILTGFIIGYLYKGYRHMSQQQLCYQFANDYLNVIAKKYNIQTYKEKERTMAVDVETDIYNLCVMELDERSLVSFKSHVMEKYRE